MKKWLVSGIFICLFSALSAQTAETEKIRQYRYEHAGTWMDQFMSFLSIPNIASVRSDMELNAARIMELMKERSIQNIQLLHPTTQNAPPAVYGEVLVPGAKQTIIFYAHYDGQPVDSSKWVKGSHPFRPVLTYSPIEQGAFEPYTKGMALNHHDWRIMGRGASDDKAGVMAILLAYESIKANGYTPAFNIKFFFEGEEEAGSPHLDEILQRYSSTLQSDLWIICDGPVHQSGKKMVSFGVRGDAGMEITVYGSKRPLHSGHYGNWAPNPALQLSKLLASMKDDNGKVLVKGFYDHVRPLTVSEKQALAAVPPVDAQMKNELGFSKEETKGQSLSESIMLPSININGMQSAGTGKLASNVIPTTATANLDLRLVPGTDYIEQQQLVEAHIRKEGFHITHADPTDAERKQYPKIAKLTLSKGYNAQRTPIDLPIAQKVIAAVRSTTKDQVVLLPSMGGSLPLFLFEKYLSAKTITVPIANHDNNQHAENENLRIQNLWDGVETMAALMLMK
jgi:acetylornithine deacetylase/succinyl-diaminopimelate desuccinylase-like protein